MLFRQMGAVILLLGIFLGIVWHWQWAVERAEAILPAELESKDLLLQGRIASIPQFTGRGYRFKFLLDGEDENIHGTLQLSSFFEDNKVSFTAGSRWRFLVRLKRPHGFVNLGGVKQEARLFSEGIVATGYIRPCECNKKIDSRLLNLTTLRATIYNRLNQLFTEQEFDVHSKAMLLALVLGEKSLISSEQWQLFSNTGTTHLFIISGLHIGLVCLLCFRLINYLARLGLSQLLAIPAPSIAALISIVVALFYSLLAGWTLPTQRAYVMCCVFMSAFVLRKRVAVSLRFLLALAVVLTIDPLASQGSGFWLSFSAVGALLLFVAPKSIQTRSSETHFVRRTLVRFAYPQFVIWVGLFLPLSVWIGQASLVAPLVNLFAIPMIGLFVVPLLLLATAMLYMNFAIASYLFELANSVVELIYNILSSVDLSLTLQTGLTLGMPNTLQFVFLLAATILILLPRSIPYRWLALPLCTPIFFADNHSRDADLLRAYILDVGQGLAVVLQTQNHVMLYDTGPGAAQQWNAGRSIVLPTLRHLGIKSIDRIIVSHGDADHAGGLISINSTIPVGDVLGGEKLEAVNSTFCRSGESWSWDGVNFRILHPVKLLAKPNNNSCVLAVSVGANQILLPGDIDASIERDLVLKWGTALQSSVLIAAHHGSKTSSSFALLKAVAANHVVFASGYRNGFGHPAAEIVVRHSQFGSILHNTAMEGMLSISLGQNSSEIQFESLRQRNPSYWDWSGVGRPCRYC